MFVVAMGKSGFRWSQQRLVSNSDAVIKSVEISPGMGVNAGHQCGFCYPNNNLNTQLIPIVDLWADPHCNNNLR